MVQGSAQGGGGPVAHILVRGRQGIFVAEVCEIADGMVSATGRSRCAVGANYRDFRWGPRSSYTWPLRRISEIRWLDEGAQAA